MSKRFRSYPKTLQPLQTGPLGKHLDKFAALLVQQGYCSVTGWNMLRLVADLSGWMVQRKLRVEDLNEQQTAKFLGWRWQRVVHRSGDQSTLALLLRHLRQVDIVPPPVSPPLTPIDLIERDYGRFLRQERGFMSASVGQYLCVARRFLWHRFRDGKIRPKELCTKDVTGFVLKDSSIRGRRSTQLMTSVLRSFLNYLFQEGRTATNLAAAIPATAGGRLSELPRYLEKAQVEKPQVFLVSHNATGVSTFAIGSRWMASIPNGLFDFLNLSLLKLWSERNYGPKLPHSNIFLGILGSPSLH